MEITVKRNKAGEFIISNLNDNDKDYNKQFKFDTLDGFDALEGFDALKGFDARLKKVLHEFDIAADTMRAGIEATKAPEGDLDICMENEYFILAVKVFF